MTTLTEPTLAILLDRLFAESDALEAARRHETKRLSPEQRAADRADYLQFYGRLKDQPLPFRAQLASFSTCWRGQSEHGQLSSSGHLSEFQRSISRLLLETMAAGVSWAANSSHRRYCGREKILLPAACPIWWKFAKAMRYRRLPEICLSRSILFSSTERKISIRPYSPCLRGACVPVLLLLPTTRTRARSICPRPLHSARLSIGPLCRRRRIVNAIREGVPQNDVRPHASQNTQ